MLEVARMMFRVVSSNSPARPPNPSDRRIVAFSLHSSSTSPPRFLPVEELSVGTIEDRRERIDHRIDRDLQPLVLIDGRCPAGQEPGGDQSVEVRGHVAACGRRTTRLIPDPERFASGLDHGLRRRPERGEAVVHDDQRTNVLREITRPPKSHPVLEEIDASPVGESGAPRRQSLLDRVGLGGHHQSFNELVPRIRPGRACPFDRGVRRMLEGQRPRIGSGGATSEPDLFSDSMKSMSEDHSDRSVADDLPTGTCLRLLHDREP